MECTYFHIVIGALQMQYVDNNDEIKSTHRARHTLLNKCKATVTKVVSKASIVTRCATF